MAALGLPVMGGAFSIVWDRLPERVEVGTYAAAGFLSVVLISGVNFALGSDFRWLLVAPVILWLAAMMLLGRRTFDSAYGC